MVEFGTTCWVESLTSLYKIIGWCKYNFCNSAGIAKTNNSLENVIQFISFVSNLSQQHSNVTDLKIFFTQIIFTVQSEFVLLCETSREGDKSPRQSIQRSSGEDLIFICDSIHPVIKLWLTCIKFMDHLTLFDLLDLPDLYVTKVAAPRSSRLVSLLEVEK